MNTQKYDWHNPENVDPSKLGEGWRFCLVSEIENPPEDAERYIVKTPRGFVESVSRVDGDMEFTGDPKSARYFDSGWNQFWAAFKDASLIPLQHPAETPAKPSDDMIEVACAWCGGSGMDVTGEECETCDGKGRISHRVPRPTPPEPGNVEVDYDSDAHKLECVLAFLEGKPVQRPFLGEWRDSDAEDLPKAIRKGCQVRIKPAPKPEPVALPLDDIKLSEWIICEWHNWKPQPVTDIRSDGMIGIGERYHCDTASLRTMGAKIHRNGQWQPCSRGGLA